VFENIGNEELDNVTVCFGVHRNIEIGIQSDIPINHSQI
jgi:hypothetical protein